MNILTLGDEMLLMKAAPIEHLKKDSAQWNGIVQQMFDLLKKGKGIGLAGPQIGC